MADAEAIYRRIVNSLEWGQVDRNILSVCILAEAIIKLGESIERAAKDLKIE